MGETFDIEPSNYNIAEYKSSLEISLVEKENLMVSPQMCASIEALNLYRQMCSFHTQKVCGALLLAHVISPTRLPFSFLSLCSVLNQPVYDNMTFKIVPQILKTNGNFFHIRRGFNQQFRDGAKTVIYQFKTDGPTMDMMSISAVVKSLSQISLHSYSQGWSSKAAPKKNLILKQTNKKGWDISFQ